MSCYGMCIYGRVSDRQTNKHRLYGAGRETLGPFYYFVEILVLVRVNGSEAKAAVPLRCS